MFFTVVGTLLCMQLSHFCDKPGQTAVELARDSQMQQVLCVRPVRQLQKSATRFEGQLLKRSRFLGWKPIWVSFTFCLLLLQIASFSSGCLVVAKSCEVQQYIQQSMSITCITRQLYAVQALSVNSIQITLINNTEHVL
jgi:hypothetical protein